MSAAQEDVMKTATLALLAGALIAGPALAQMKPATTTRTTTTKTTAAKPMATKTTMVRHTTTTGKKVTYDCSKKGNANKTACKK